MYRWNISKFRFFALMCLSSCLIWVQSLPQETRVLLCQHASTRRTPRMNLMDPAQTTPGNTQLNHPCCMYITIWAVWMLELVSWPFSSPSISLSKSLIDAHYTQDHRGGNFCKLHPKTMALSIPQANGKAFLPKSIHAPRTPKQYFHSPPGCRRTSSAAALETAWLQRLPIERWGRKRWSQDAAPGSDQKTNQNNSPPLHTL